MNLIKKVIQKIKQFLDECSEHKATEVQNNLQYQHSKY